MYDFKKDFPLFKDRDVIYLDNAATAQKPACVIEAEKEFYENIMPIRCVDSILESGSNRCL